MPILKVADAGGRFDGSPFPASATIAGVVAGVDSTPASSLDNVTPTLTFLLHTTSISWCYCVIPFAVE